MMANHLLHVEMTLFYHEDLLSLVFYLVLHLMIIKENCSLYDEKIPTAYQQFIRKIFPQSRP